MESLATVDEKAFIVERFISSCPSGSLKNVVRDLQCLLGSDTQCKVIIDAFNRASKLYYEDQLWPVVINEQGQKCLITPFNNLSEMTYFDPRTFHSFRLNTETESALDVKPVSVSSGMYTYFVNEKLREIWLIIDKSIGSYVQTVHFNNSNCSTFIQPASALVKLFKAISLYKSRAFTPESNHLHGQSIKGRKDDICLLANMSEHINDCVTNLSKLLRHCSDDEQSNSFDKNCSLANTFICSRSKQVQGIVICTEIHDYQWQNMWTGSWRSQWVLLPYDFNHLSLIGVVKVQIHYFEDSNIQFNSAQLFRHEIRLATTEPDWRNKLSEEIISLIRHSETVCQQQINCTQYNMSEQILKSLRRQLPLTKSKINWDSIAQSAEDIPVESACSSLSAAAAAVALASSSSSAKRNNPIISPDHSR